VPDGKCGYVVKPEPEAIAEAINDFFVNNRSAQFTIGVREAKEKFTWDKLTATIIEIYNKTIC
jgi:glycosyltransferase involved in cell wall biosynthesis